MNPKAEELISVIHDLHVARLRMIKIFRTLPDDMKSKHSWLIDESGYNINQVGHSLSELVLALFD